MERKSNCYVQKHWTQIQKIPFICVTAGFYNEIVSVVYYTCQTMLVYLITSVTWLLQILDNVCVFIPMWMFHCQTARFCSATQIHLVVFRWPVSPGWLRPSTHLLPISPFTGSIFGSALFLLLSLRLKKNTWSTGALGVPTPHLNITEGNLCLTLRAHIKLMMVKNISNQDHKSVASGSSNTFRPPVILFKTVKKPSSSPANNPWNSNQSGCVFLHPTSWNVSICSFKGLWGFVLVTSGKLSLGTRGNTHKRSPTRLSRSFRNQFNLNYLAPIPDKSGLVALNVCLISCC